VHVYDCGNLKLVNSALFSLRIDKTRAGEPEPERPEPHDLVGAGAGNGAIL